MATRLLLGFILFSYFSLCQTEEQRKYAVENFQEFKSFILAPESNEPLLTHFHSKDVYLDLYLDTPEQLLLKNNFSLRFRKRILDATNTNNSYSFQLKNEMDSIHSIRMEVEEKELYFYFAKSDTGWIPLTDLLDTIFYNYENYGANSSNSLHRAITILKSWITFKVNGAIAPFQKLLFLDFKTDEIKTLRP